MKMKPQDWIAEIDRALMYRKIYAKEFAWRKNELNFVNDEGSDAALGRNLVFEMGDTLLSSTGALDPEYTVVSEHPAGVERAPIVESVDNYLARKMKIRKHVNRSSMHSYLYSRAILKIGYDSEFGWSPPLDIGTLDNPFGMTLSQFDRKTGYRIENKDLMPGMPWLSEVLPHDFVVPWGVIDMDDSPWVAHRVIRLTDDIIADPKYSHTKGLKSNMSMEDFVYSYMTVGADRLPSRSPNKSIYGREIPRNIFNELWEIHNRRTMEVIVVTRDHNQFLRKEPDAVMLACGMPFVSGSFVEHPRSFWGTPLAYYLGQLQADEYDISLQEGKQRRISVLRFIAAKGFMKSEKLQRLISGQVGAAEFADVMDGLKDKIVPMPTGSLFPFQMEKEQVHQDARSAIGFSRNQGGEFDAGTRRTKGEAMLVAQGSLRRESPRIMMIKDLYLDAMSKVNRLIFTYWTRPRSVMVDRDWVKFTGQELKGDYLYDLSLAAKRDLSKAERKVEAMMMLTQLMPLLQGQDPKLIFEYLNNAANDPAFERLMGLAGKGGGQGSQQKQEVV